MKQSPIGYLLLLLMLFSAGGASCRSLARRQESLAPVVFVGPPTLDDIIYAVNTNSAGIHQLNSENASVSTPGVPSLRATLAVERPRNFRLRAKLIGQELDLGSNQQLFWMWAKSDPEHAVYFAYHDQFVAHAAHQGLPIGPDWLIESLGLVQLDPAGHHEGPVARPDQRVEIRSRLERNGATFTRVLVLDPQRGWIVEQQILDQFGRSLATARCSEHHFYQMAGASLPHRVQIELPSVQQSFQIEVGRFVINQRQGDASQWELPYFEGCQLVNIASPDSPLAPTTQPASLEEEDRTATGGNRSFYEYRTVHRPRYRGLE